MEEKEHNCIDLNRTKEHIQKYGLSIPMIEATDYLPSFAYSVGLQETFNHPEIICLGLDTQTMHSLINNIADIVEKEGDIKANQEYDNILENYRATFLKVDPRNIEDYFGVAINFYGTIKIDALQLIWTDRNNKFPWEDGFEDVFKYKQPLLDRNADFKFREPKNLCIFTTEQWVNGNAPILRVYHEENGDWQFLTDKVGEGKLVALEQIILRDPSLNEVFDLEYGEKAERSKIGGRWERSKI
ncbi:MAG: DUF4262 domain-containing protein [Saprospiraceae bacterium]|nr:DUF4262 domain-containing protein [Saprospiraceae bacterium]